MAEIGFNSGQLTTFDSIRQTRSLEHFASDPHAVNHNTDSIDQQQSDRLCRDVPDRDARAPRDHASDAYAARRSDDSRHQSSRHHDSHRSSHRDRQQDDRGSSRDYNRDRFHRSGVA